MRQKITKRTVDQLAPDEADRLIWDTDVKGFGVRCRPSGAKVYVLKMRVRGRQRWLTIGQHGSPWTPEGARVEAKRLLGLRASGKDPAAEREHERGVITVAELGERFLDKHVARRCKPTTAADYRRAVQSLINPALGRLRITEVDRADIARLHQQLEDHPYQANRVLAVLSKMFNLAEEWGLRADGSNPCRHVKKFKETKRERYLRADELQRLGTVLREAEGREGNFAVAAIRLLLLTGARLSEILTLKWEHVDEDSRVLRLPDSKTGAKVIHLNEAAMEILRRLPHEDKNPHVIPGHRAGARLVNLQAPWRRIRTMAGLDDVRIHDLRHSYASVAAGLGLSLPMIGNLLGHSQPATTHRYAHHAADPTRAAADLIGVEIQRSLGQPSRKRRVRLSA